mgnify:CR=1 FL=1
MREPDKNRVRRAMEHIMAAITNINSIKWENRTDSEDRTLEEVKKCIADEWRVLKALAEKEEQ